ncbi:NUDIX domain-containing protein [Streptomyces sp. NPDC057837]|uniref:NUDIX domain-containing protein n=1 Tax=Streptomyces sp. NPDC057837 TaxID=3346260 RepID=UPI00368C07BD
MTEILETIRYTADIVCIRGNHVLTIERGWPPHQGQLALPGGHVDPGETSLAAAARELLEETGVRVNPSDLVLVGIYDQPDRDPRGRYVTVAYTVTVPADTVACGPEDEREVTAMRWVPLDQPGDLAFDHGQIVADAMQTRTAASWATGGTVRIQPAIHHSA